MYLDYQENGFEVSSDTFHHFFIPYQAISLIKGVEAREFEKEKHYNESYSRYFGNDVCKVVGFSVILNNNNEVFIYSEKYKKAFPRFSEKYSILKVLFSNDLAQGLDSYSRNWLKNLNLDMEDFMLEMEKIRNDLINHFNKWKNNHE